MGTNLCLHCSFPDYKDAISNETRTRKCFFHIHLLIHAHCISICFPPITSITQSQSLSQHIFHLSLSSLSSINLNIRTLTVRFQENPTLVAETSVLTDVCCLPPFLPRLSASPRLSVATCTAGIKETDPSSTVWSDTGVSLPQGSLGEWVPAEICLNARGSVCPRQASLALMDVSVLLIVGLQKKMCISFFMHSLCCGL